MPRTSTPTAHPYTSSALDAPAVVTGPVVLAVAPDGESDACIVAASDVAARLGAALEAVCAIEQLATYAIGTEVMMVSPELEASRRVELEARTRDRLARVLGARPWRCDVRYGSPARVAAGAAMERHATLLVAGAGRHGLTQQLLGTEIALQAVRLGDRPVLAVQPAWRGLPRRIVCAVDFSPASVRAARLASALLADGGVLQLLLVTPPSQHVGLLGETWLAAQRTEAKQRFAQLRALLEPELPPGAMLDEESRAGLVVDEVLEAARRFEADLIAVGTQGRGFLERLFVGSTATGVLRRSTLSVLCAPPPPATERAWTELRMRGATQLEERDDWKSVLDAFTRRHAGRRSWLEVDDPASGAQLQQRGLSFAGASYDHHDGRVSLVFLDPATPTKHLTRDIPRVGWIAIRAGMMAGDEVLCIAHGRGQTLLGFMEA
jgi:nucleotide-binding universal stress UspA family protein